MRGWCSYQRRLLRDNLFWRGQRLRDGLQNHHEGDLTTQYSFCAQSRCTDGEYPEAALVQATIGDFLRDSLRRWGLRQQPLLPSKLR
jgi:hypothetical protein